jgi:O-acetyl-ADP-ribose deacetylase (regulator of RNase III)
MNERLCQTIFSYVGTHLTIANCITQLHFGKEEGKQYVSYRAIQECFESVAKSAYQYGDHVNYPLIGAGLGGGDWAIISEIIDNVFAKPEYVHINRTLWIYE